MYATISSSAPGIREKKNPNGKALGSKNTNTAREGQQIIQPTNRPTEYRCYIKEVFPYATAGAVTPSWNTFLRPPDNSPFRWHLTQGLLLCSGDTIHEKTGNVNRDLEFFSTGVSIGKYFVSRGSGITSEAVNYRLAASRRGQFEPVTLAIIVTPLGSPGSLLPISAGQKSGHFCPRNVAYTESFGRGRGYTGGGRLLPSK